MRFVKMEGLGNDFVVLDGPVLIDADQVRSWCDRRRGIGADGVLAVTPLDDRRVRMEYWNADGSMAEMCGNGLRCVARYAFDRALVNVPVFVVETAVGPLEVEVGGDSVRAELGAVRCTGSVGVADHEFMTVDVGNPHAVTVVDDVATVGVGEVGPVVERSPEFTQGTNVEFVRVVDSSTIDLRVWERGVGETLACGTGAAAAVAAASEADLVRSPVTVHLPGGDLLVELQDGRVWITGPARLVFEGRARG